MCIVRKWNKLHRLKDIYYGALYLQIPSLTQYVGMWHGLSMCSPGDGCGYSSNSFFSVVAGSATKLRFIVGPSAFLGWHPAHWAYRCGCVSEYDFDFAMPKVAVRKCRG